MDKKQALADYEFALQQQKKDFKEVFTSDAGQRILKALREEFYDVYIGPSDDVQYRCGERNVILSILERING